MDKPFEPNGLFAWATTTPSSAPLTRNGGQFERLRDCLTGYADIDTLERSVRSDVNVLRRRLLRKKLKIELIRNHHQRP